MKKLICISIPVFCILLLGFTAVDGSLASNQNLPECSHDCGLCPSGCGLTANVSISVNDSNVSVRGWGAPGAECTWDGMAIYVQFFNPTTESWEPKTGYNGPSDDETRNFNGAGYSKVRARVITQDHDESGTHHADTGWQERNL